MCPASGVLASGTSCWICPVQTGCQVGRGLYVLVNASMALALSAHTLRVQLSVRSVGACWRSELGWDTPSRYLASLGPVNSYYYHATAKHYIACAPWHCKAVPSMCSKPWLYVTDITDSNYMSEIHVGPFYTDNPLQWFGALEGIT